MSDTDRITRLMMETAGRGRNTSDAAMSMALGLVALLVGLIATMAGTWIAYWHGAPLTILDGVVAAPDTNAVSLYLVVCGTVTTIFGGLSIYRSQGR